MKYDDLVERADVANESEFSDNIYFQSIGKLRSIKQDLSKLHDTEHLTDVIRQFLVKWGGLARVVSRKRLNWSLLGRTLSGLEGEFELISGMNFLAIDFRDETPSGAIRTIYEKLDLLPYLGGPTTISKILHLLNPEIFVMWDSRIREMYKTKNSRVSETAGGYLEFLRNVQRCLKEAMNDRVSATGSTIDEVENQIRQRYKGKTLAKIADEYNWARAHSLHSF